MNIMTEFRTYLQMDLDVLYNFRSNDTFVKHMGFN